MTDKAASQLSVVEADDHNRVSNHPIDAHKKNPSIVEATDNGNSFGESALNLRFICGALEIAKSGIRANSVAPGAADTGMLTRFTGTPENKGALTAAVPMGRLGLSEELANAIVFIASDEASFITGYVLNVDGGKTVG
jgi:enoyl-[acyl-carrier-protein] reductase (NADH)